jgi:adenosylcobinamide-GDP ribazoletransferase
MWADVRGAFAFLTVLPLGYSPGRKPGWSFAAYPLVGLCIGVLLAGVGLYAPFPPPVTLFAVLAIWVIVTGGLHLDGFGDSCDGLLATVEPARRLEIMKDPRAGSWAVVGLIVLLLGKWAALQAVSPVLFFLPPVIGRWAMVLAAWAFPYARAGGLGGYFRDGLGRAQVGAASALTLAITLTAAALTDGRVLVLPVIGLAVVAGAGRWAAARLNGGLTGDVYGALCELTELLCLIGMCEWADG